MWLIWCDDSTNGCYDQWNARLLMNSVLHIPAYIHSNKILLLTCWKHFHFTQCQLSSSPNDGYILSHASTTRQSVSHVTFRQRTLQGATNECVFVDGCVNYRLLWTNKDCEIVSTSRDCIRFIDLGPYLYYPYSDLLPANRRTSKWNRRLVYDCSILSTSCLHRLLYSLRDRREWRIELQVCSGQCSLKGVWQWVKNWILPWKVDQTIIVDDTRHRARLFVPLSCRCLCESSNKSTVYYIKTFCYHANPTIMGNDRLWVIRCNPAREAELMQASWV